MQNVENVYISIKHGAILGRLHSDYLVGRFNLEIKNDHGKYEYENQRYLLDEETIKTIVEFIISKRKIIARLMKKVEKRNPLASIGGGSKLSILLKLNGETFEYDDNQYSKKAYFIFRKVEDILDEAIKSGEVVLDFSQPTVEEELKKLRDARDKASKFEMNFRKSGILEFEFEPFIHEFYSWVSEMKEISEGIDYHYRLLTKYVDKNVDGKKQEFSYTQFCNKLSFDEILEEMQSVFSSDINLWFWLDKKEKYFIPLICEFKRKLLKTIDSGESIFENMSAEEKLKLKGETEKKIDEFKEEISKKIKIEYKYPKIVFDELEKIVGFKNIESYKEIHEKVKDKGVEELGFDELLAELTYMYKEEESQHGIIANYIMSYKFIPLVKKFYTSQEYMENI